MTTTRTYAVGDTIEYSAFGGVRRTVLVTNREEEIKNGRPGFDGITTEGESVWGTTTRSPGSPARSADRSALRAVPRPRVRDRRGGHSAPHHPPSREEPTMTATAMPFDPTRQAGLHLTVLRSANGVDCTNRGLSSTAAALTLVGVIDERLSGGRREHATPAVLPAGSQVSLPDAQAPAALLRVRRMGFQILYSIEPAPRLGQTQPWYMAGGNYAVTSDSRFADLMGGLYGAISIHDRQE
jgi:hypothetical protein